MRPFTLHRPDSSIPELFVRVPDSWDSVQLAPLFDAHIGNPHHDSDLFRRHVDWIASTPNVITWNGGDLYENLIDPKMGHHPSDSTEEWYEALRVTEPIHHKFAFAIPGNHEDRTYRVAHFDAARVLADRMDVPYFPDYCFCTFQWRGLNFRLGAHHGTGAAQTAGAQRMAARKDLAWAKPDMLWTGHLHQPLVDTVQVLDYDQRDGRAFFRDIVIVISPSYLEYFSGYAAKKRLAPGLRGLTVATLQSDGRIDVTIHARGKRL